MTTAYNSKQLSQPPQDASRKLELRVWMVRNGCTYRQMGQALDGITGNAVQLLLSGDRIPCRRHAQLLEFGVPEHLLPPARDVPKGKPAKQ